MVLVGMGEEKMRVNMLDVVIREIEILGCFRYVNTVRRLPLHSPRHHVVHDDVVSSRTRSRL